MAKRKTKSKRSNWIDGDFDELIFTFQYAAIVVSCNPEVYDEYEEQKIQDIVNQLCEEIVIDKSYVEFPENKHEKTFMYEKGWKALCRDVISAYGARHLSKQKSDDLVLAYTAMIICYLDQCLEDLGYDCSEICLEMQEDSSFMSKIEIDEIKEWKHYPGNWQTWDQDTPTT